MYAYGPSSQAVRSFDFSLLTVGWPFLGTPPTGLALLSHVLTILNSGQLLAFQSAASHLRRVTHPYPMQLWLINPFPSEITKLLLSSWLHLYFWNPSETFLCSDELEDWVWDVYHTTPPMSTYFLAIVVAPLLAIQAAEGLYHKPVSVSLYALLSHVFIITLLNLG